MIGDEFGHVWGSLGVVSGEFRRKTLAFGRKGEIWGRFMQKRLLWDQIHQNKKQKRRKSKKHNSAVFARKRKKRGGQTDRRKHFSPQSWGTKYLAHQNTNTVGLALWVPQCSTPLPTWISRSPHSRHTPERHSHTHICHIRGNGAHIVRRIGHRIIMPTRGHRSPLATFPHGRTNLMRRSTAAAQVRPTGAHAGASPACTPHECRRYESTASCGHNLSAHPQGSLPPLAATASEARRASA